MKTLKYTRKAIKQIKNLPDSVKNIVNASIKTLKEWPDCRNIKALSGMEGYRLRVGNFRIIFEVEDNTVIVKEVKKRDEHTYN